MEKIIKKKLLLIVSMLAVTFACLPDVVLLMTTEVEFDL